MCERYGRRSDKQRIAEWFHTHNTNVFDETTYAPSYNFAPQSLQPVVRLSLDTGQRELAVMRWGLVPFWSKDGKAAYSTINARAETIAASPAFREAWKRRIVPYSVELRRALTRHIKENELITHDRVFGTSRGTRWDHHNVIDWVKRTCRNLGFEPPARTLHAFRHTFAVNYLRRGGSTFHLQKSLGHSTLDMTRRYANLTTDDLTAVHQRVSLLHRL